MATPPKMSQHQPWYLVEPPSSAKLQLEQPFPNVHSTPLVHDPQYILVFQTDPEDRTSQSPLSDKPMWPQYCKSIPAPSAHRSWSSPTPATYSSFPPATPAPAATFSCAQAPPVGLSKTSSTFPRRPCPNLRPSSLVPTTSSPALPPTFPSAASSLRASPWS